MANVHVVVTNNYGQTIGYTLDEADDRIEYFRRLVRREDLADVEVKPAPEAGAEARKTPAAKSSR